MKKKLFLSVCVALAMAFALPLQAQRLIPKQKGIEVVASVPIIRSEKLFAKDQFGVGVSLTKYLKRENYAFLSAKYEEQSLPYRDYQVPMRDMLLQVGYMQPILSDRGKNIFAYLGISALGGYEELNEGQSLLPDGATLLDRSRFIYGGAMHLSFELFLTDNVLLLFKGQGRVLFGSDLSLFRPALSAGLRFNL